MAKQRPIPGTIYERRNGRLWWKVKLPNDDKWTYMPLRGDGARYATKDPGMAEEIRERLWRTLGRGTPPSMAKLLDAYEQHCHSVEKCGADHLANKLRAVSEFVRQQEIGSPSDITKARIQTYLDWLAGKGRAAKTRINRLGYIHHFCEWLTNEAEELVSNPARKVAKPADPRGPIPHLTARELRLAIKLAAGAGIAYEVAFAAYTGARRGEMMRLRHADLEITDSDVFITLRSKKAAADRHTRTIVAHPELAKIIRAMPQGKPASLVFPSRSKGEWSKAIQPIRDAIPVLGRKGGGWHDFRRTLGSLLIQAGERIEDISAILGHSEIGTTSRYYAQTDAVRASRRALGSLE